MSADVISPGDRRRLGAVAYRILGSFHDAEDVVQETQIRWSELGEEQRSEIREPIAWLTRVASRIALELLGSARSRRESSSGIWLPEPAPADYLGAAPLTDNPSDLAALDESISLALLVAMETLSPAERVALILHDSFGVPFEEIGGVLGRSGPAARQLASSARQKLRRRTPDEPQSAARDEVVIAFRDACAGGDITALVAALHPDVASRADGGTHVVTATRPVVGADNVARYLLGLLGRQQARTDVVSEIVEANGLSAVAVFIGDEAIALLDFAISGGQIREIAFIVDPEKLTAVHRT
ncbi:MAG: sigma-70 family RNA polymerase sigma factor [Leifsonia sp.]